MHVYGIAIWPRMPHIAANVQRDVDCWLLILRIGYIFPSHWTSIRSRLMQVASVIFSSFFLNSKAVSLRCGVLAQLIAILPRSPFCPTSRLRAVFFFFFSIILGGEVSSSLSWFAIMMRPRVQSVQLVVPLLFFMFIYFLKYLCASTRALGTAVEFSLIGKLRLAVPLYCFPFFFVNTVYTNRMVRVYEAFCPAGNIWSAVRLGRLWPRPECQCQYIRTRTGCSFSSVELNNLNTDKEYCVHYFSINVCHGLLQIH